MLASISERSSELTALRVGSRRQSSIDKLTGAIGNTSVFQSDQGTGTSFQCRNELLDLHCVGFASLHRSQIQFEVRSVATFTIVVALLTEHDLIDQSPGLCARSRNPNGVHASQRPLQGLQNGHEIPDSEDVILHEYLNVLNRSHRVIERM